MDYPSPPHGGRPPPGVQPYQQQQQQHPMQQQGQLTSSNTMDINMLSFQPLPMHPTTTTTSPPHQQQPLHHTQQQLQPQKYYPPPAPPTVTPSSATGTSTSVMPPPFPLQPQPTTQQSPSKAKPIRKRKSPGAAEAAAVSVASSSSDELPPPLTPSQNKCKDLRSYVVHLLSHKEDGFSDIEFAERALMNIARKISSSAKDMDEWKRAIVDRDASASCVTIVRPKDGRLTIARPNANSTKKVFPQVLLCQAFRWPHIVFHNDVKSAPDCAHQTVVKPPEKLEAGGPEEYVCINPFHYVMTAEATARFNKQARKRGGAKNKAPKGNNKAQAASKPPKDEGFSESEPIDFDDKGEDLIKMWDERISSKSNADVGGGVRKFNDQEILDDIKLLSLSTGKPLEREERLKLLAKLKRTILSGEYLKGHDVREDNFDLERALREVKARVQERRRESESEPATSSPSDSAVAAMSLDEDSQKSSGSGTGGPADDSAIQDLLDDIRGSFERQFDDEFENLSAEDLEAAAAAASETAEPFSNIDTSSFPMESGSFSHDEGEELQQPMQSPPQRMAQQQLHPHQVQMQQQQQYHSPPTAVSASGNMYDPGSLMTSPAQIPQPQQPMPCIVNSWTMGGNNAGHSNANNGASTSSETNAYPMAPQGDYYYSPPQQQTHPMSPPDMYQHQQYNPHHAPQQQSTGTPYHAQQHYHQYEAGAADQNYHQ